MPYYGSMYVPNAYKAPAKPRGIYTKGPIRVTVGKPRGIYTKGPITSQGTRIGSVATPKAKPKTSYSVPQPKLAAPKTRAPATGGGGILQLPGTGSSSIASIYARTSAQLKQMASEAVHLEVDPQVSGLQHGYNVENSNYGYLINSLRKQLGLSKGDINQLYGALDVQLAVNAKKQGEINTDTKAKMGAVYDQLGTSLGQNYGNAQAATSAELSRMGMQNPQANDRLTSDEAFLKGTATTSKANSQALLDAVNASTQGMMQGLRSGNAATSAMLQTGLQQQFDKESGDALQKHLQKLGEIKLQIGTLKKSMPGKINQTYAALLDQQYQREMDAAQKLFDNQIKLGNFQISQSNAASTQAYRQNQLALEAQRIALSKKPAAAKPAALKGMDKSLAYLQSISKSSHVPYKDLENLLIEAINGDPGRIPAYDAGQRGAYSSDIANFARSKGYPQLTPDLVRAMNYWFGA